MADLKDALLRHSAEDGDRMAMSDCRSALSRSEIARWIAGAAAELGSAPETVGILGENSVAWAVAFLAASVAGKTIVPIPTFFSHEQLAHLAQDAGIARVLATEAIEAAQRRLPVPVHILSQRRESPATLPDGDGGLIIYTSGSTGTPERRAPCQWSGALVGPGPGYGEWGHRC